jgi:site-specific recombinase XerD
LKWAVKQASHYSKHQNRQDLNLSKLGSLREAYESDYAFLELGARERIQEKDELYRLNYKYYFRDLKAAMEMAGLSKYDFATHDFRRCFGRKVWDKYKDLVVLQRLLNHNSPQTSIRYLDQSGLRNFDYLKELQK